MSYTVQNVKQELPAMMHGTTLDNIEAIDQLIYRAARQLLLDLDPQETIRICQFTNPIYSDVYDYALPTDLKGNGIIDIRPQTNRNNFDIYGAKYNQDFDTQKKNNKNSFTINFNSGNKTVRINAPTLKAGVTMNEVDAITGNGTWSAGGDASNLAIDNIQFASGVASLKFDLAAAGSSGYLENSTMTSVDLTEYLNQGAIFFYAYFPTASDFTSVDIRWGTDNANYYHRTLTTASDGTAFQNGQNLMSALWLGATVVGTPDVTDIKYARVTYNYNGNAQTAVKLDNIVCRLGSILEVEYYSKFLFRNASTGAWQETVLDDADIINLDTETYNLLLDLVGFYATQQIQGLDAKGFDNNFFGEEYKKNLARYKALYKSQKSKPQQIYYRQPKGGYGRFTNTRFGY